jgi:hypothetical protein
LNEAQETGNDGRNKGIKSSKDLGNADATDHYSQTFASKNNEVITSKSEGKLQHVG